MILSFSSLALCAQDFGRAEPAPRQQSFFSWLISGIFASPAKNTGTAKLTDTELILGEENAREQAKGSPGSLWPLSIRLEEHGRHARYEMWGHHRSGALIES